MNVEGVNIYLGVGIVLVLAAVVGGIKGLGFQVERPRNQRARIVLLLLGLAFGAAAYLAPLPGTAKKDRDEAQQAYQQQVLAACQSVKATKHSGDNALQIDENGLFRRDPLVQLMNGQIASDEAVLAALWAQDEPADLGATKAQAEAAGSVVIDGAKRARDAIQAAPDALSQDDLNAVMAQFPESATVAAQFASAMSHLAGQSCDMS